MSRPPDAPEEPFIPDLSEGLESGLYLALLELLDEGLVIASDEQILEVNSAACHHLARRYGELVGQPLNTLFPGEAAYLAARERLFIQGQMRGTLEIALPDGRLQVMRYRAAARLRPGLHALILSPDHPVEHPAPPRPADTLWPRLAAALDQPVIVVDGDDRVVAANTAALRRLELARTELVGHPLAERVKVTWPLPGGELTARLAPKDGETLQARILPGPRSGWRLLVLPPERSPEPAAPPPPAAPEALPDARHLSAYFAEAQGRARSRRGHVAILNIHADQLQVINEQHGRPFGDRLLQHLAHRLKSALPAAAQIARDGRGGFIALLPDLALPREAENATTALTTALAAPLLLDGQPIEVATSLGVALFPGDGNSLETLLRHAELARQQARQAGGGLRFYCDEMNTRSLEHRALEASLRHAIERQELELHFVPEWRGSVPPAAEALLRWRHPDLGLIPSRRLLPLLRQGGLMADFGAWALARACLQASRWGQQGTHPDLVVNVALEQLADPAFPGLVARTLADTGLPPGQLMLDLDNTMLAHGEAPHLAAVERLAALGVKLALDNFGQGLLSLRLLSSLPLATLRLDPALVRDSLTTAAGPKALEAALALGQALGLQVVAKGVDSEIQRATLVDMGFTAFQGPLLGGPVDAGAFARRHFQTG